MDARHLWLRVGFALSFAFAASVASAAAYRTPNFIVHAPTAQPAQEIGIEAERLRKELALEWTGKPMPNWSEPCPIKAKVAPQLGAGGATSFIFDRGQVFGWEMEIQGSRERVLDSVLPHEITHTVFACHFRQPLPRWADEGACTTTEHEAEVGKQERLLIRFLKTGQGIPFSRMFAMKEYPPNVMPLYSQGHSLATFLIERRGKAAFLQFLADGMQDENWPRAVEAHYGHGSLMHLQTAWLDWVKQGRPRLDIEPGVQVASAELPAPPRDASGSVYAAMAKTGEQTTEPSQREIAPRQPAPQQPERGTVYDAGAPGRPMWR